MSKKIIINLLDYAQQEEVQHLIISRQKEQISLDCYLPNGQLRHLSLPHKLENNFFADLKQIMAIGNNELITKKYHKITHHHKTLAIYLTVLPDRNKEKIIIDLLKRPKEYWRLSQLGLKTMDLKTLKKTLTRHSGLIIITSPPGKGKSSTLYAISLLLNDPKFNIYFLSKDIPKSIPGINILNPSATSWERLRGHDSEIILADDLDKDWELTQALLTALTGRLVVATINAKDAKTVIKRIKQLPLSPRLINEGLRMIISQDLVPLLSLRNSSLHKNRQLIGKFELIKL